MNGMLNTVMAITIGSLLLFSLAAAQDEDEETTPAPQPDQEVGISEENYRRHMELGDVELQRNNFPVTNYAGQAELQKMGRLPEASQRYLRDQLRDQIVQGGAWTPGETLADHPFEPSPAARGDGQLRQLESEAWDELVGQYLAREQELQARTGQAGGEGREGNQGRSASSAQPGGPDQTGHVVPLDALGAGSAGRRADGEDTPSGQPPGTDPSGRGAAQSALEFLTGGAAASSAGRQEAAPGAASASSPSGAQSQATPGSEQNAAQQLTAAAAQQVVADPATVAQASSESKSESESESESESTDEDRDIEFREQEGVLVIRELRNARGVTPVVVEEEEEDGEEPRDEDDP